MRAIAALVLCVHVAAADSDELQAAHKRVGLNESLAQAARIFINRAEYAIKARAEDADPEKACAEYIREIRALRTKKDPQSQTALAEAVERARDVIQRMIPTSYQTPTQRAESERDTYIRAKDAAKGVELFPEVKTLVARADALIAGLAAPNKPEPPATDPPPKKAAQITVYETTDGTKIRAVTSATSDQTYIIRTEAGEMVTVKKQDVRSITKE